LKLTTTLKVGKIEITSDVPKTAAEFASLIDQVLSRLDKLIAADIQIETGQAAAAITTAPTAATAPATSAIGTVTQV
jgi:hypothetical protein